MNMLFTSAMEHGVIEQTQGSGALAASTVRLIQRANAQGKRIYRATSSNKTAVLAGLDSGTYSTGTRADISALLATANDRMLLPQTGMIVVGDKTMGGYAFENPSLFQMKIGKLHGGYSAYNNLDFSLTLAALVYGSDPGSLLAMSSYFSDASYMPYSTPMLYSWDPVEMASGAYVLDKADLILGDGNAPLGLTFSRHYHSNRRYDNSSGLGYGWTHNNDIFLTERSAPEALMGAANGYQMAPFIAAAIAAKDLHTNHANAKQWATCALAVHWGVEQMKYTAVAVSLGGRTFQFIKLPDGSYVPPPGMNLTLTKTGSTYSLTERHGNTITFNSDLKASTIKNPNGATQIFTYNGSKQLTSVKDHFNRTLTYTWSGGNISSVSDGTTRSVSMAYTNGDMISFTDPEGKTYTYQYDPEHRMTSFRDPDNRTIAENDYDADSRVTRQRSMGDINREWTYLYTGYVNTEIDPLGGATRYFHDARGRSIGTMNHLGHFNTVVYDGQDRKTITLDHKGARFDWIYDSNNNIETTKDERGFYTDYYYDGLQGLEDIWDARGGWTTFSYTVNHQVESVLDQVGNLIVYSYHGNGLLESITDGEGNTTTTEYDTTGGVMKITSPDLTYQEFTNNPRGDVLTVKDAEGRITTNTWNKRRQLLTTTLPPVGSQPSAISTNTYDSSGNLATSTDANGNVTTHTYNALAKPLTTTLPSLPAGSNVLTTTYDERDWAVTTANSLGHTSTTEHDVTGRADIVCDGRIGIGRFSPDGRADIVICGPNHRSGSGGLRRRRWCGRGFFEAWASGFGPEAQGCFTFTT
jgi:YD repeat-containing protein